MLQKQHHGHIDAIIDGVVSGWAVDATGLNHPASLFAFIDNRPVANFSCDSDRPDLAPLGLRTDLAGFRFRIPPEFLDDAPHTLAIRFPTGAFLSSIDANGTVSDRQTFQQPLPVVAQGVVDGLKNGALHGWVVVEDPATGRKHGGIDVLVTCDGVEIGRARADKYRPDVAKSLGCDPHCGFAFTPPLRFRDGQVHSFRFHLAPSAAELGNSPLEIGFPTHAATTRLAYLHNAIEEMSTQLWRIKRELREVLTSATFTLDEYDSWARQYQKALRFRTRQNPPPPDAPTPLVSILCPVYRPRLPDFTAAVESVLAQTYRNWELILVDDNSRSQELTACIESCRARDPRIRVITHRKNGGISAATNTAIAAAKGEYIALFDHDDMLLDVAVETMVAAARRTGARLLYSDEDKIDDHGRFSEPNLKPDWNYRLLLAQNYVCHFLMVAAETLRRAGPLDRKYDGAQDHDLILRLAELVPETEIAHVPEIIYHWRKTPGSTAATIDNKSYAVEAGAAAVRDHLKRRGHEVAVSPLLGMTTYEIDWRFKQEPKVCVVIPFREQIDLTRECLERLRTTTAWRNLEIILVDNWSTSEDAAAFRAEAAKSRNVRVLRVKEAFNYSRLNNLACRETDAEFFLFMNNDVFVTQKDWLRLLVNEALADKRVAAVGAKLLYPNGTVQHGGVILGVDGVGDHAYRCRAVDDPGFMGRGICAQDLSAVTAALMLCRAESFRAAGGFDEENLAIAYNDVDLCLKLRALGLRVIWTPAVTAEHRESVSRGDDMNVAHLGRFVFEEQTMLTRWGDAITSDPFYNPHFSPEEGIFEHLAPRSLSFRA